MRSLVVFLAHDFKPFFRHTLSRLDASLDESTDAMILLDSSKEIPHDLILGKIGIVKSLRHPSPFDPIGQAHNFYLDFFRKNPEILDSYDHFWILENDVYYHGNIKEFFDIHADYDHDLLVPEYGLRHKDWCWLNGTEGIRVTPTGVTAVIYRSSVRLMRFIVENVNSRIKGHMEVILPHICTENEFSIQQFVPDHVGPVNTFMSPLIDLVEKDLTESTQRYIQNKLYHPIKK